jgi:hypothetical protein
MADTVPITAGSGTTIATDDVGGIHYQRVKISHGAPDSAIDSSIAAPFPTRQTGGTIATGNKTVTTVGTEVQLVASSTPCLELTITALPTNTNLVAIGDVNVVAAVSGRRGTPLSPGESITLGIDDVQKVYLDSVTNGEGVCFTYIAI